MKFLLVPAMCLFMLLPTTPLYSSTQTLPASLPCSTTLFTQLSQATITPQAALQAPTFTSYKALRTLLNSPSYAPDINTLINQVTNKSLTPAAANKLFNNAQKQLVQQAGNLQENSF